MPAIRKRKTYTKRRTSKKSRTNSRLGRWKVRRWLRNKKPYKVAKLINVANNREIEKKVVKVQKISKKQRNIVRKRFREGYSPFIDRNTTYLQLVSSAYYNKANWASFIGLSTYEIYDYFKHFPYDSQNPGGSDDDFHNSYIVSETQSLYIGRVVETLEIVNPTNYDVNLVIYDFIYKDNVINEQIGNELYQNGNSTDIYRHGPIGLIRRGLNQVYSFPNNTDTQVADPTNLLDNSINLKPTDSYPFNIYCRIVKKTVYRLQPGASLKHMFIIKPKALINRGYFSYKYVNVSASSNVNGAMKDVTYGMLCKTWGQIANSGNNTSQGASTDEVTNLPGNITFKRTKEIKWYAMDSKYTYIKNEDYYWTPGENERPEVVNDESIRVAATMNLDATDNNNQAQASTSGS